MAGKGKFELIHPPNRLAAKAPRHGGPKLETIVAEAEKGLQEMEGDYRQQLHDELECMSGHLRDVAKTPEQTAALIEKIRCISHDIRGQGATFGLPLITEVAQLLCELITNESTSTADRVKLIAFHIDAMRVIVAHDIRGSGGAQGQELVDRLRTAVDKTLAG